ncbi:MAG: glycosyltransferase family 4 protein [Planctomycetes bacterium]|nr:glycosyltransferase family 4 protein [Planctomycetota bacterium]
MTPDPKRIDPAARLSIVHNPSVVEKRPSSDEVDRVRERLGSPKGPVIAHTVTLEVNQGIDLLLESFAGFLAAFPGATLAVAGGTPEQIERHGERAQELGVARGVRFLGRLPMEEMAPLMAAADVLVTCRNAGTNVPLKVYSCLQAERPILATDAPCHRSVLSPGVALLVRPAPGALAEGMERLVRDRSFARSLASRARLLWEAEYGWERHRGRIADWVRGATRRKGR